MHTLLQRRLAEKKAAALAEAAAEAKRVMKEAQDRFLREEAAAEAARLAKPVTPPLQSPGPSTPRRDPRWGFEGSDRGATPDRDKSSVINLFSEAERAMSPLPSLKHSPRVFHPQAEQNFVTGIHGAGAFPETLPGYHPPSRPSSASSESSSVSDFQHSKSNTINYKYFEDHARPGEKPAGLGNSLIQGGGLGHSQSLPVLSYSNSTPMLPLLAATTEFDRSESYSSLVVDARPSSMSSFQLPALHGEHGDEGAPFNKSGGSSERDYVPDLGYLQISIHFIIPSLLGISSIFTRTQPLQPILVAIVVAMSATRYAATTPCVPVRTCLLVFPIFISTFLTMITFCDNAGEDNFREYARSRREKMSPKPSLSRLNSYAALSASRLHSTSGSRDDPRVTGDTRLSATGESTFSRGSTRPSSGSSIRAWGERDAKLSSTVNLAATVRNSASKLRSPQSRSKPQQLRALPKRKDALETVREVAMHSKTITGVAGLYHAKTKREHTNLFATSMSLSL
jgi:hypothetical protein